MHVSHTDHRIVFHVPDDLRDAITAAAEADGRPVADWVRRLVAEHLGQRPPVVRRGRGRS